MLLITCIRAILLLNISVSTFAKDASYTTEKYQDYPKGILSPAVLNGPEREDYISRVKESVYKKSETYYPSDEDAEEYATGVHLESVKESETPTTTGPRSNKPKDIICKTWTTQVLDCSDQPGSRQKGEKGEKGESRPRELFEHNPYYPSFWEEGEQGEVGSKGDRGVGGADGKAGVDGSHGYDGKRGEDGDAGPGCEVEELEDMRRKNEIMEEEFEVAKFDSEELESEYEMLRSSHDEIHNLLYKFMGG